MKIRLVALVLAFGLALSAQAGEDPRLDGSSNAAAEATWKRIVEAAPPAERRKLLEAVIRINLAGVHSAYEVVGNPEFQELGIARIKDQVDGMTAAEIIAYGEKVGTVKVGH
ncbi:MAG: hypothetical protein J0H15_13020 [Xanthomonadales bacterium]|nr:hypothetical protein [Xanthomonadales bacterium]